MFVKKRFLKSVLSFSLFFLAVIFLSGSIFFFLYFKNNFQTEFSIKEKELEPYSSLTVNFSRPMLKKETEESILIEPAEKVEYFWRKDGRELTIKPVYKWENSGEHALVFSGPRNVFLLPLKETEVFDVEESPRMVSFYPENGIEDFVPDIEDPIKINFNRSLENYSLKIGVFPEIDLSYEVSKEKNEIKVISTEGFKQGEKYEFQIFLKHKKDIEYQNLLNTSFRTAYPPQMEWEKDFSARLAQAKKYTKPGIKDGRYIDINLKSQVMVIFENGLALDSFLISSGKRGMDTPQGSFQIRNKSPRPWSKKYSLFMPYWMALVPDGKFGIHELPEWPGGYKEGVNHLGTPVSHGCVRLGIGSAEKVYNWAEIGTPVLIHV